jgi:osmoprotectant transport system permease protein
VSELLAGIPPLLASHLELVIIALALACAIGLPLAMLASSRPRLAFVCVTAAGIVQTVPGLALLALMVPLLAKTGVLAPFGFPPAVIALTLYALLPVLRNAVTGIRGVDAAAVDAARGMGMSPWQIMRLVELPLAAPVIAAGIRTATVWTVGAATLATPVGQPSLGNYIFAGLQTRNFGMLLVGVACAAGLALVLDALLAYAERALGSRHPRRALVPAIAFAVLVVVVVWIVPRAMAREAPKATALTGSATRTAVTRMRIGGKPFTEQYVLIEALRTRLEAAGIAVDIAQGLGSTVVFDALVHGDVDAYVDYSGTLWANAMKRASGPPRWQILTEVGAWLAREHHVRSLGSLGFDNAYTLAVRRPLAEKLGLHSLRDLARVAPTLSMGTDYEFLGRPEWASVRATYGIAPARTTTFDPTLLYDAVARGDVDVISAFSSDGRIAADDLVVLGDPDAALPAYDAMILLGPRVTDDVRVLCALGSLHVPVERMRRANAMVDRDHAPALSAAAWLLSEDTTLPDCSKVTP